MDSETPVRVPLVDDGITNDRYLSLELNIVLVRNDTCWGKSSV